MLTAKGEKKTFLIKNRLRGKRKQKEKFPQEKALNFGRERKKERKKKKPTVCGFS
jgi:hypothetical protein